MADDRHIIIKGPLGTRELEALSKNLTPLVVIEGMTYFEFNEELDCFFFAASKATQRKHWNDGYVLSVFDAQQGDWESIHEPANF